MENKKLVLSQVMPGYKSDMTKDKELKEIAESIPQIEAEAKELVVDSPESNKEGSSMLGRVMEMIRAVEKKRKQFTEPLNMVIKAWNNSAKGLSIPLKQIKIRIDTKILDYHREIERKAEEARRKREKEEAEKQRKIEEQKRKLEKAKTEKQAEKIEDKIEKIESKSVTPDVQVQETIRSENATVSIKKNWTHTVINPMAVPREYLKVDEVAIGRAVKGGVREIPGVRIFQKSSTATRKY